MVRDPVCHMELDQRTAFDLTSYGGRTYYFCSEGCKGLFEQSPAQYAGEPLVAPGSAFDLIVVGGGPAGLTAAVYASIQRIHTLVITENVGGQAVDSSRIKNYMGFDFITGTELADKFRDQLIHEHFVEHKLGSVTNVEALNPDIACATFHVDRHQTLLGGRCVECHGVETWNVPGYRHPSPRSRLCAECHAPPPSHLMMHFQMVDQTLTGQSDATVEQCWRCHTTDHWNNIKGVGFYKHH